MISQNICINNSEDINFRMYYTYIFVFGNFYVKHFLLCILNYPMLDKCNVPI